MWGMSGAQISLSNPTFFSTKSRGYVGFFLLSPWRDYIPRQTGIHIARSVQELLCAIQKTKLNEPLSMCKSMTTNVTLITAGGSIRCPQCNAKSKRTGIQCRAPAAKGKTKCRFHGGASTGPKTEQGRQRCAKAKTIDGNEGRSIRNKRSLAIARLALLAEPGYAVNLLKGSRTRGRKPRRIHEAYPALQELFQKLVVERATSSA